VPVSATNQEYRLPLCRIRLPVASAASYARPLTLNGFPTTFFSPEALRPPCFETKKFSLYSNCPQVNYSSAPPFPLVHSPSALLLLRPGANGSTPGKRVPLTPPKRDILPHWFFRGCLYWSCLGSRVFPRFASVFDPLSFHPILLYFFRNPRLNGSACEH